uniref:Uncharacterized protein n=1 Tax=Eucampia antarctica TaxID=49252 RepID=A0A7S2S8Y9_9STRA|mmetsp:Transcript_4460/g.4226  ORF Transcript_4460/g.4226 Transcript_4460/m.4226 type:complete len:317 (+) Transcript_4460:170-1120(+)
MVSEGKEKHECRLPRRDTMEEIRGSIDDGVSIDDLGKNTLPTEEDNSWEDEIFFEKALTKEDENFAAHASKRFMTRSQEIWNAITVLPGVIYCIYFVFNGLWQDINSTNEIGLRDVESYRDQCINWPLFPKLYACPPWTVIAVAVGVIVHAPFSFLYHIYCAFLLPPGPLRMCHWTRKFDQCFIHILAIFWSYGSSGSRSYLLASTVFNFDCIFRLFWSPIQPRRTLIRMLVAILVSCLPLFLREELLLFCMLLLIYATGGWLFATYPFGGWSHSAFHIVFTLAIPIFIQTSATLQSCQEQVAIAAHCKILQNPLS